MEQWVLIPPIFLVKTTDCSYPSQFAGENVAASSINAAQWRVVDIIYLFQTIASTGLLSIPYPTAYTEFVLNFKWAMGVWHTTAVQKAIDNAREITGGASDERWGPSLFVVS